RGGHAGADRQKRHREPEDQERANHRARSGGDSARDASAGARGDAHGFPPWITRPQDFNSVETYMSPSLMEYVIFVLGRFSNEEGSFVPFTTGYIQFVSGIFS